MTESEARSHAATMPGVSVRRYKGTWHFDVRFHTTDGWRRRYAGKDVERAKCIRQELIETHSKRLRLRGTSNGRM